MARRHRKRPTDARLPELPNAPADDHRRRWMLVGAAVVIAVVVAAAHWPALHARAICIDDQEYLLENPLVQNPSWDSARRFLTEVRNPSSVAGYYQPLNMISLMLDCAAGGGGRNLTAFHRTSLILHVLNTLGVMLLLYLLFRHVWAAAIVALLFGVHPMTVEPIPWIGERKTLLAAFFGLACLILYVLYARRRRRWLFVGVALTYVLALMSKPTSTPLPVLMLLMDVWPLKRIRWRCVLEKVPLFILGGISAVITVVSQSARLHAAAPGSVAHPILILCHNIIFYPYKMLWPMNLTSHYPIPQPMNMSHPMVLVGVVGTVLLLAALAISLFRTRALATGWLIFFVAIFPAMGVITFTNVIASDKFAYLPAVGLLMPLAYFLGRLWGGSRGGQGPALRRIAIGVLAVALAVGCFRQTRRYLTKWQDTISLYRHMDAHAPNTAMLLNNLAYYVEERGSGLWEEGLQRLATRDPNGAQQRFRQAGSCFQEAGSLYGKALKTSEPKYTAPLVNYGKLLLRVAQIRMAEARGARDPSRRGELAAQAARLRADAERYLRTALQRDPRNVSALNNLGAIARARGDEDRAVEYFTKALKVNPNHYSAHANLGAIMARRGRYHRAAAHYRAALRTQPGAEGILKRLEALVRAHPELAAEGP